MQGQPVVNDLDELRIGFLHVVEFLQLSDLQLLRRLGDLRLGVAPAAVAGPLDPRRVRARGVGVLVEGRVAGNVRHFIDGDLKGLHECRLQFGMGVHAPWYPQDKPC